MSPAPPPQRRLCVLGATGSIGAAALAVARARPQDFAVKILTANNNARAMAALAREFAPQRVVMAGEGGAEELARVLRGDGIAVEGGAAAVCAAAASSAVCTVVAGIATAAGTRPALAAAAAGKRLLLANKEALITAGPFLLAAVAQSGGELLPIDSEHCALFELLRGNADYAALWLTASGGATRDLPPERLREVTPAMAVAHPNWSMGRKISVDSATMMNKALEVMEASFLFNAPARKARVVMHPQSVVHAFVEFADGSLHAALSAPDMRQPLARMMSWPRRLPLDLPRLSWSALSNMQFAEPDERRYPCLRLAYDALQLGGAAPAALSAANEAAVERFLAGEIKFTDIAAINADALTRVGDCPAETLDDIFAAAKRAGARARQHKPAGGAA